MMSQSSAPDPPVLQQIKIGEVQIDTAAK